MRRLRRWYIPACRGQRGPAGHVNPQAGASLRPPGPAPACGPHCSSSICFTRTVLTTCLPRVCFIATAVRRSHSSCYYYYYTASNDYNTLLTHHKAYLQWFGHHQKRLLNLMLFVSIFQSNSLGLLYATNTVNMSIHSMCQHLLMENDSYHVSLLKS